MDDQAPPSQATVVLARAPGVAGDAASTGPPEPADLIGLLAVVGAGLLPLVFIDDLYWGAWAPKAALCLVLLGPGLVVLARLLVAGNRPARLAAAFLAAAGLSTVLSDEPVLALVGSANRGTGLLFVATLAGAWALGASAGERRRRQMVAAMIAATLVNAAVAWAQARVGVGGRTAGLMGNPVFLGGLVGGGLFLVGWRFGRDRRSWWWLPAVALLAGAAQLSGGRAAVAVATGAVVASLRRVGMARGAALIVAVAVGVLLAPVGAKGAVLGSARVGPTRSTPSLPVRGSEVSRTDIRFLVWGLGVQAVGERPLIGAGPGRFAAATGPLYDVDAAKEGVVLGDAHNWVVEYAVTTGVIGLCLLLAWIGTAGWRARGPLAGFALVVAASSLVQPLHVALTPMAFLALGAAGPGRSKPPEDGHVFDSWWAAAVVVALGIGVAAAGVLLAGQAYLQRGVQDSSPGKVGRASALSPPWPEVALTAAGVEAERGLSVGEPHKTRTLQLTRRATHRDPAAPAPWTELGALELAWGTDDAAAIAFSKALERYPWDSGALLGRVTLASRRNDQSGLAESCRRLRALNRFPQTCPARQG